jgi:hypothetical protein
MPDIHAPPGHHRMPSQLVGVIFNAKPDGSRGRPKILSDPERMVSTASALVRTGRNPYATLMLQIQCLHVIERFDAHSNLRLVALC